MAEKSSQQHDYLAIILVGGGSAFGRSPDKDTAIKLALRFYKKDWGSVFVIKKGDEVTVNVVDVSPHKEVTWSQCDGFFGDGVKFNPTIESVHRSVP